MYIFSPAYRYKLDGLQNKSKKLVINVCLGLHPRSFPGHQPELDLPKGKAVYNDWNTTSMASYKPYGQMVANQVTTPQVHPC